jgi:P2 family phage contractile tail tube protein
MKLPEVINNFNVYDGDNNRLMGISDEVTLPNVESKTATVSGAGVLGDFDVPVSGQFNAMEFDLPFRLLYGSIFSVFKMNTSKKLVLRGSEQIMSDGEIKHESLRVSVKGRVKSLEPGKVKGGESMGSSVKLSVFYLKITISGKEQLYIDVFNNIFRVDGIDMLADIRKNC